MALRYLLILGDCANLAPAFAKGTSDGNIQPTEFKQVRVSPHCTLFINSDDFIAQNGAFIIGRIFTREAAPRSIHTYTPVDWQRFKDTQGQSALSDWWGGYVAGTVSSDGQADIVRDPSAALPCLYTKFGNAVVLASDTLLLVQAGLYRPEIDWPKLSKHLIAHDLRTSDTCLIGIVELLAGHRFSIRGANLSVTAIWSPWDFAEPEGYGQSEDLAENLESTVIASVGAMAQGHQKILLGVSGGLDSSIIAASLKAKGVPVTCFTVATHEAEGDERAFARILTSALDLPLIEAFHDHVYIDIDRANSPHLPRPVSHPFGQSLSHIKFALERAENADAFFSGVGGDNVFCFTQSATSLVDRFRAEGLSSGLWRTLEDICRLTHCSLFDALRMAYDRYRNKDPRYSWKGKDRFLNPNRDGAGTLEITHPWLDAPPRALAGKAVHVAMMARIQGTIDGLPRDHAPQLLPLLSQPVVEACLRIPMWCWISGGRNRAVARHAFANRLPSSLLNRESKGGPNSFAYEVVERHKDQIRERLVGGRLADKDLLDTVAIKSALSPRQLVQQPDHMDISALSEVESWVRYWEQIGSDVAKVGAAPFK